MKTKIDLFKFFKLCFAAAFILTLYFIRLDGQNKRAAVAVLRKTRLSSKAAGQIAQNHRQQ